MQNYCYQNIQMVSGELPWPCFVAADTGVSVGHCMAAAMEKIPLHGSSDGEDTTAWQQ